MNIGSLSTPYASNLADIRPAELNSVGRNSASTRFLSERPVPSVDPLSPVNRVGSGTDGATENSANVQGEELDAESNAAVNNEANQRSQDDREAVIQQQEREEIQELAARDREVRAHEQAHAAIGGVYAGAPQYQFQRGPDGVSYAVGGEVSIDVGKASSPEETIRKMQIVRRAALAPAEPSPQDRSVAAQAAVTEAQARQELAIETREQAELDKAEVESDREDTNSVDTNPNLGLDGTDPITTDIDRPLESDSAQSNNQPSNSESSAASQNSISRALQQAILAYQPGSAPGSIIHQLA